MDIVYLRRTSHEVGCKHHGEVGGIHLGDSHHICGDEHLEETNEVGEDDAVELRQFVDQTDGQTGVFANQDRLMVGGGIRDEGDVELSQPLLEQGSRNVGVSGIAALPLVKPTLHAGHLVKVSGDAEDALGAHATERYNLVGEGGEDPWEAATRVFVFLDIQDFQEGAAKHGGAKDL